jgi:hypothetical protein
MVVCHSTMIKGSIAKLGKLEQLGICTCNKVLLRTDEAKVIRMSGKY